MSVAANPVSMRIEEVVLAEPRGFCASVDRAIEIVERALAKFGAPIYVRHEIVHNTYVVNDLKAKGAIFIEDLAEVPPGATLVFSAHGVSKEVQREAERRGFRIFDATCPLVTKVHSEAKKYAREGFHILLIGDSSRHQEVIGTRGEAPDATTVVSVVGNRKTDPSLASPETVTVPDPDRVRWWEVMAHIRWAVIALQQGDRHDSGAERSLHLALTGRIADTLEYRLLQMTAPEAA